MLRVCHQRVRQWLQPRFKGDLRLGPPLGLVGQVEILQPVLGVGFPQCLLQCRRQFVLLGNRLEDGEPALVQLSQVAQALIEVTHLRVVQSAGDFLPVARDEGHRGAFIQQSDGGTDLAFFDGEFFGDALGNALAHGVRCGPVMSRRAIMRDPESENDLVFSPELCLTWARTNARRRGLSP